MNSLLKDITYSFRMFRKNPGFTAVAVIALALGIGATSAIFSVVYAVALRPLPYKEPDRLVKIWGKLEKQGTPKNWLSVPELYDIRDQTQSFDALAAYITRGLNLTGAGTPERVATAFVSARLFPLLGVKPALGRTFTEEEDEPGNNFAIVSDRLWKSRFGASPDLVGSQITLTERSYTVLGVMPPGFDFPGEIDLWIPIAFGKATPDPRSSHYLEVIARLKNGVTLEQAASEVAGLANKLSVDYPNDYPPAGEFQFSITSLHEETVGNVKTALWVLMAAVALVLLIACANVANMLLARATAREREVAIRAALGAARARIIRQLLTESVLLAAIGGALGVVLAYAGVKLFVALGPEDIPRINEISVNPLVLGFTLFISILTGVVFGLVPALQISKTNLQDALKEGGRGSTGGRRVVRNALVVAEVSFALMLLIVAGLTLKSFQRLLDVNLGFQTENIQTMRITLPGLTYNKTEKTLAFYQELLGKVSRLPGVESVGAISHLPLSGANGSGRTLVGDTSAGEGLKRHNGYPSLDADRRFVTPGYFESLRIRLIDGRFFHESDTAGAQASVIVDEKFARRFWPDSSALGKTVAIPSSGDTTKWGTIVGVVSHIKHYATNSEGQERAYFPEGRETVYFPVYQFPFPFTTMYLTARTSTDPTTLVGAIRAEAQAMDPNLTVYEVKTLEQLVSRAVSKPRLNMALLGGFAIIALVLAAVGIYGVISYSVTQRTHEIGIRMALGAQSRDVLKMIIGQGLALAGLGIVIGLAGAWLLTRLMSALLFEVSATDPMVFALISLILAGVALAACFVPARRATKVDPMIALRYE